MYVMVDFICLCLLELQGTHSKKYEIKKILPTVGLESGTFRFNTKQTHYQLRHEIRYPQSVKS